MRLFKLTFPDGLEWYRKVTPKRKPFEFAVVTCYEGEWAVDLWTSKEQSARAKALKIKREHPSWEVEIVPIEIIEVEAEWMGDSWWIRESTYSQ